MTVKVLCIAIGALLFISICIFAYESWIAPYEDEEYPDIQD